MQIARSLRPCPAAALDAKQEAAGSPLGPFALSWATLDGLRAEHGLEAVRAHLGAWLHKNPQQLPPRRQKPVLVAANAAFKPVPQENAIAGAGR